MACCAPVGYRRIRACLDNLPHKKQPSFLFCVGRTPRPRRTPGPVPPNAAFIRSKMSALILPASLGMRSKSPPNAFIVSSFSLANASEDTGVNRYPFTAHTIASSL
jgi:hypothetical protein